MANDEWAAVDRYIADQLLPADAVLTAALAACASAGLPEVQVTPPQGKLLWLLATLQGARNVLEIGTLGGYSTIWLARALPPNGRLITLECEPKHADIARANFVRAGLNDKIEIHLGRALDTLPQLAAEHRGPFDLTFIDADKANTSEYFAWALKLSQPGSLIIADNVVRDGAVLDSRNNDPNVQGVQRFYEMLSRESRVHATAIQTVGAKGYDGFAIARVVD